MIDKPQILVDYEALKLSFLSMLRTERFSVVVVVVDVFFFFFFFVKFTQYILRTKWRLTKLL